MPGGMPNVEEIKWIFCSIQTSEKFLEIPGVTVKIDWKSRGSASEENYIIDMAVNYFSE